MPYPGSKGLTLRLFDRETALWSLIWSSSHSGKLFPPVTGRFEGGRGELGDELDDGLQPATGFLKARMVNSGSGRGSSWSGSD